MLRGHGQEAEACCCGMLLGTPSFHDAPLLLHGDLGPEPLCFSLASIAAICLCPSRLKTGGCPVFSPVAIGATRQLGQLSYTNAAFLVQLVLPNSYLGCWQDRYSRTAPKTLLSSRLESQGCTGPITRRGSELLGHGGQLSYTDPASHSGPAVPTRRLARP